MSRYLPYNPDQGYLVPPRVDEVLDADHLCFFIRRVVERLDLGGFEEAYSAAGGMLYHPSLMLKVWLYAYALGVTSSRRLERRIREDLAFSLSGGRRAAGLLGAERVPAAAWACDQRLLHPGGGDGARVGPGQLGTVAIDATRIKASASPDKVVKIERGERARTRLKVRRWQQACDADDPNENAGSGVGAAIEALEQVELSRDLAPLPRPRKGVLRQSATDPDARFLRARGGRFVLGYTGEIAVSEDHLIVAQRVTAQSTDNASLVPMVELVKTSCGSPPGRVIADSGYYSNHNAEQMEALGIDAYVPDSNLARELNLGHQADDLRCHDPRLRRMREKMRSEQGRHLYRKRKAIVEPVFGVLKQQRNLREFRLRSLDKVAIEFALAATAYNLTRIHRSR